MNKICLKNWAGAWDGGLGGDKKLAQARMIGCNGKLFQFHCLEKPRCNRKTVQNALHTKYKSSLLTAQYKDTLNC